MGKKYRNPLDEEYRNRLAANEAQSANLTVVIVVVGFLIVILCVAGMCLKLKAMGVL